MSDSTIKNTGQLGTFSGVFTPSVLTILGIILFLRLGYVVGSAGLTKALIIICVANLISVLTSFSLAAIATNMKVKGGGDYYLISRTLGAEFGGAIGLVLFLAQSVSIAFYCIGFGEAVNAIIGGSANGYLPQIIAGTALCFLFVLAWVGADLATKFQYVVMFFLILALASFYIGGIANWNSHLLMENWSSGSPTSGFWILFALFFPAVTGFTQGVSMSGDLKDPGKSLPSGTFSAVILSILVYFSVAIIFAASSPLSELAGDYGVMKKTAFFGPFIDAGVIAATLSSAMASFLGAPRILQSLASDKIFPIFNMFAKGHGKTNNPRRGVLLSFGIAIGTVVLGQLDLIAGIVSMFFLISYGLLNYATYYEASAQTPSFRPRFKWYDKRISLAGFVVCMGVILAIDIKTGIAAGAVLYAIFQYVKHAAAPDRWSDSNRSHLLTVVRDNLIATQKEVEHPRDWRPYVIVLSNSKEQIVDLLYFSRLIEGKSGMTTAVQIIHGRGYKARKLKETTQKELKNQIAQNEIAAFSLVISSEDISNGISVLFQSFGVGPIKANTALFNWQEKPIPPLDSSSSPQKTIQALSFKSYIRQALQSECNVILLDKKPAVEPVTNKEQKTIDVWWKDDDTSRIMLLLAYLITRNESWEDAIIRLMVFHLDVDNKQAIDNISQMLEEVRIAAMPKIILGVDAKTIVKHSKDADLVFLPISLKQNHPYILTDIPADEILGQLQTVAMTMAAKAIDLDSEPEEGEAAELAALYDELKHAQKRVRIAEKKASKAMEQATQVKDATDKPPESLPTKFLPLEAKTAETKSDQANKKLLKEKAKLSELSEKAKEEGLVVDSPPEKEDGEKN